MSEQRCIIRVPFEDDPQVNLLLSPEGMSEEEAVVKANDVISEYVENFDFADGGDYEPVQALVHAGFIIPTVITTQPI